MVGKYSNGYGIHVDVAKTGGVSGQLQGLFTEKRVSGMLEYVDSLCVDQLYSLIVALCNRLFGINASPQI